MKHDPELLPLYSLNKLLSPIERGEAGLRALAPHVLMIVIVDVLTSLCEIAKRMG